MSTTDLFDYLDSSPSPWHAVASTVARLRTAGFEQFDEAESWTSAATSGFVIREGALVAWRAPDDPAPTDGFSIVGAHTDSPGLRIKPNPDDGLLHWRQLRVEVYGGALLNSWLDRDLGVAGRIVLTPDAGGEVRLVNIAQAVARIPQLAIHLDREVNERGVQLDKHQHLSPVWGTGDVHPGEFRAFLASSANVDPLSIQWWDLCLYDIAPATLLGADQSLIASGRLDNQLSCWAATTALTAIDTPSHHTAMIALFDHEEVGSESSVGAAGPLIENVIERLVLSRGGNREDFHRALADSHCVSADNAHAVHPNYPERHDPGHRPLINHGPAIKLNSNQRYATSALSVARFEQACAAANVRHQVFVSRNNMPCGSTIGPITATRLGIPTVDVGIPQLSMHSARELCGAEDPLFMQRALTAYLA